jgi:hypothetical protein
MVFIFLILLIIIERRANSDNKPDGLYFIYFIIIKIQYYSYDDKDPFLIILDSVSPILLIK